MKYRILGKTNLKVSEIGLGCEGFIGKNEAFAKTIFDYAIKMGVNCIDLYSPNPKMQKVVGKMIQNVRKDFVVQGHLCTVWKQGQYKATRKLDEVKEAFEKMLVNLNTDYIDIGMIHYVDSKQTWNDVISNGILDYAKELKEKGIIKHIGISSHNPVVALEAIKSGDIEVIMFSVNPCYDLLPGDEDVDLLFAKESYAKEFLNFDPVRKELYEECEKKGIGITVMKVFAGGELLSENSPAGKALTPSQCIHYALTRPAVSTVLVGSRSLEELEDAIYYEYATEEEKDYAKVFKSFPKINWDGYCMYCGHCAPCPKGIEIANVTKFLNLAVSQNAVFETVREHYATLSSYASDCIECGQCEKRCPFNVSIIENMRKAKKIFGK